MYSSITFIRMRLLPVMVARACNPGTRQAEAGGLLRVRRQTELQNEL